MALITLDPTSVIAGIVGNAGTVLHIQASSPKAAVAASGGLQSVQPMAALFEQSLTIVLDAMVMALMQRLGQDADAMFARHANVE